MSNLTHIHVAHPAGAVLGAALKKQGAGGPAPCVVNPIVVGAYFSPISLTFTCPFSAAWAAASLAMGTR